MNKSICFQTIERMNNLDLYNLLYGNINDKPKKINQDEYLNQNIGNTISDYNNIYGTIGLFGNVVNAAINDSMAIKANNNPVLGEAVTGNTWGDVLNNNKQLGLALDNVNNSEMNYSDVKNNYNLYNAYTNNNLPDYVNNPQLGDVLGSSASAIIGDTATGASIGSYLGPVGTVVGGALGAASGIGRSIFSAINNKNNIKQINNQIDKSYINQNKNYYNTSYMNNYRLLDSNLYNTFQEGGYMPNDNGITQFNVGSTHQQNPYGGIQQGIASDGQPNLVEENEVRYNDYIFSARNAPSKTLLKKYNLPEKYSDKKFSEIADILQKESENRPNDPISKRTLDDMIGRLANAQEEYNYMKEQRQLSKLFNSLPNEEKIGLMQLAVQQPVEQDMYNQQVQQEEFNPSIEQYASGGSIHIAPSKKGTFTAAATKHGMGVQTFASHVLAHPENYSPLMRKKANFARNAKKFNHEDGGYLYQDGGVKENIMNSLGLMTERELNDWLRENNIDNIDWDNINTNESFLNALSFNNPSLAHALRQRYDFGINKYNNTTGNIINFNDNNGNWDKNNGAGWYNSKDLAYIQAVKDLSDEKIQSLEPYELAELMKETEAYKNTTEWLRDENNALAYLTELMNNKNTPQGAKNYAENFIKKDKSGNWKFKKTYDYNKVFKPKREDDLPGSYWYSSNYANRNNQIKNYLIDDDGNIEEILTTPDASLIKDNSYSWQMPDYNITANYYKRKPTIESTSSNNNYNNNYTDEPLGSINDNILRKMPVVGSGINALLAMNTPTDFTYANELNRLAGEYNPISAPALGGYRRYNPYDVNLTNNQNISQLAGMQREFRNNPNRASQDAASIAAFNTAAQHNAFNNLKWQQANEENRLNTDKYNLGIDQYNLGLVQAYDQMNLQNRDRRINMLANAAKAADDATTLTSTNRSQGITNLMNNIGTLGKENLQFQLVNNAIKDKVLHTPWIYGSLFQDGGIISDVTLGVANNITKDANRRKAIDIQSEFIHNVENSNNVGVDPNTGYYYSYPAVENKDSFDIGDGLKLSANKELNDLYNSQVDSQGRHYITPEQHDYYKRMRISNDYDNAAKIYNNHIKKNFNIDNDWDNLSYEEQALLMDYAYNGGLANFPKFMTAIYNKDLPNILSESKRYMTKGNKKYELGRNKEIAKRINKIYNK